MDQNEHDKHYILPTKTALLVGGTLLFLTAVTVWVAHIDLGRLNFIIALFVATVKALLVALIFMNLKNDRKENAAIFATSFVFLTIFIVLTFTDIFFRGDVYVKGPLIAESSQGGSKLKKPWVPTSDLVAHGKELFQVQCVSCHGAMGKGDGQAAASLDSHPRNFTLGEGWKNGRKPSQIFKTIKEGIPNSPMPSFPTLPSDDRWALVHYVASLGPSLETDSAADLAKIGIDPSKENAGASDEAPSISVALAMKLMAEEPVAVAGVNGNAGESPGVSLGARLYTTNCLSCHGDHGQGGVRVRNLGVNPKSFVVTAPLSLVNFNSAVIHGLPGNFMPAFGQLSQSELRELYHYAASFKR